MARSVASTAPAPAPGRRTSAATTSRPSAGRGMNAFKQATKESAKKDFGSFQVPYDTTKVIVFLEAENFDFVYRHWVETVNDEGKTIKVPRNCIADEEKDVTCPLCGIGDEPKPLALFNVVDLDEPGKVQIWEASKGIFDEIDDLASNLAQIPEDRGGPLELNSPGVYAAVSKKKTETKSGRGGFTKYSLQRVKERDLDEDHGLDPLTDEQFEAALAGLKTIEDIPFSSYDDLAKLARELED